MSKIAVRVRGNDVDGYRVQYTYNQYKLLSFMTLWFDYDIPIKIEGEYMTRYYPTVPSYKAAEQAALKRYNELVDAAADRAAKEAARRKAKNVLWVYPS